MTISTIQSKINSVKFNYNKLVELARLYMDSINLDRTSEGSIFNNPQENRFEMMVTTNEKLLRVFLPYEDLAKEADVDIELDDYYSVGCYSDLMCKNILDRLSIDGEKIELITKDKCWYDKEVKVIFLLTGETKTVKVSDIDIKCLVNEA